MAVRFLENILGSFLGFLGKLSSPQSPFNRLALYLQNDSTPNAIPDYLILIDMYGRGYIDYDEFVDAMRKNGFDRNWSLPLAETGRQFMSAGEYITAYHRGVINEQMLDDRLERAKYGKAEREYLKKIGWYFPNPSDLVRFAVREVYDENVVRTFQMDSDLPQQFLNESRKAGLPEEQARNYWRAHWELPAMTMGFEMFHRQIISEEELKLLMRTLDVMPFWRDKLIQMSYNPLTRVDVRRMYGLGVLDEKAVEKSYRDIGYSPENAKLMTDFTIKYESNEMDGLTRATVVNAYEKSIITKDQLIEYLHGFGYNENNVQFWVDNAEYDKALTEVKEYEDDLAELFQIGAITIEQIRAYLLDMGLPSQYIEAVINRNIKLKAKRTKVPSISDLTRWLTEQLIDENYYVMKMRAIGYQEEDIQIYLTEIAEKKDTTKIRYLKLDVYQRWLLSGIITVEDFIRIMREQNYKDDDIQNILSDMEVL